MILIPHYRTARRPAASAATKPLDGYTTSLWAAWSTRQLLTSYTGNLIRVKRSSDSTEQDIGQIGGLLDEAALAAFVGANTGYIVTYYDQSGNGRDNSVTIGNGPSIVVSGTIQRMSGIACGLWTSTRSCLRTSGKPTSGTYISTINTSEAQGMLVSEVAAGGGTIFAGAWLSGSSSTALHSNYGTCAVYIDSTLFSGTTRDNLHDAIATSTSMVVSLTASAPTGSYTGVLAYDSAYDYQGSAVDLIVYSTNAHADRASIEAALGAAL